MTRLLFVSPHCYLDHSNGASITARQILLALAERNWQVDAFCGALLDYESRATVETTVAQHEIQIRKRVTERWQGAEYSIFSFCDGEIKSVVFDYGEYGIPSTRAGEAFLRALDATLRRRRPEIVLTYGGYWLGTKIVELAKKYGAKTVVLLQNFAYDDPEYFHNVDLTITPSHFASGVYRERLVLRTTVIPPLIDWSAVTSNDNSDEKAREYALFVNPDARKGAPLFARIVAETAKVRPDVKFLLVEGSARSESLATSGVDLTSARNLYRMKNTGRPRDFYSRAKLALVPSFFDESFGRVAAEAVIARVPVVASNRGALPETLGDAAILIDIPAHYTPDSKLVPTAVDAERWLRAILKLWDDPGYYAQKQALCAKEATRWEYERIAMRYDCALRNLLHPNEFAL